MSPRLQELEQNFKSSGGKWVDFQIGALFDIETSKKRFDANKVKLSVSGYPYVVRTSLNNGIKGYLEEEFEFLNDGNTISFGQDTATMFYQKEPYFTGDKIKIMRAKFSDFNSLIAIYLIATMTKAFSSFSWGSSSFSVEIIKKQIVSIPVLNDKIAFSYMEKVIKTLEAERIETLEAYLTVTGLKNYQLTNEDNKTLAIFNSLVNVENKSSEKLGLVSISMESIFTNIEQGRRLKKSDQIVGELPFVMAGTTNTGIVGGIANKVEIFPENSITIDIFGNTFYRGYEFGAGDDTGVFWNESLTDKLALLYIQTVIGKSLIGKYDFGYKLRASQTHKFELLLPCVDSTPDYQFMARFIRVVEKIVVHDLVEWTDKKIEATKEVVTLK
ncbi:restriction endonuclease subunit S [Listeria seeligeri]|uniref:restriction endonuclease subunit S n=1 Tax=Listeria seeligeri TaxID=1640 RepID=UPI001627FFFA|nr:restriction endonuclease subunit S [Listeria seeligeri]MBC1537727.1 restriction endonuclease subunit S [Listeria seeligeri]MBC1555042.1 restriction endonuclease subunit S [Listeria seeligeri]MBC6121717.1 restriction endonuclease subunit S [Listeria seeligeri]